jgi:hypothetical protein
VIASGRWTGEEAYRKINKSPVQLVEGTDFIKLPREEALNRKVQRQRVHIPTLIGEGGTSDVDSIANSISTSLCNILLIGVDSGELNKIGVDGGVSARKFD